MFAKALWVARDRIITKTAIDDLLADSVGWNIRDLVVQVRGRGDAYYAGGLEPRAEALDRSDLDPLGHLVRGGAAVGVRIHAWANGVTTLDPAAASDGGVSIDPTVAAAREHAVDVFEDIVRRYAVEGFHHGHVHYPQTGYAYSADDRAAVSAIIREAATRLRAARPGIVISAAVIPNPIVARDRALQGWPEWAAEKLVDLVCPMAYRTDTAEVGWLLGVARAAAPSTRMWGGLLAYAGERVRVRDHVRAARDAGCDGAILFAYDPAKRDVIEAFATEAER